MTHSIVDERPDKGFNTVREIMVASAHRWHQKIFVQRRIGSRNQWQWFSFSDVLSVAREISTCMMDMGFTKGDHLALISENRPEWPMVFLAYLYAGFVAIPIDATLKSAEIESILSRSQARFIVASSKFLDDLSEMKPRLADLTEIACLEPAEGFRCLDDLRKIGAGLLEKGDHRADDVKVDPADIAEIIFTSGTTGTSKGVILTHNNLARDTCQTNRILDYFDTDGFLSVLPLHHTFETTAGMLIPLIEGCTITYTRSLKSKEILEDMEAGGSTIMLGVPLLFEKLYDGIMRGIKEKSVALRVMVSILFFLTRLSRSLGWNMAGRFFFKSLRQKASMGKLRIFVSGAAAMNPKINKCFWDLGIIFLQGYGLTETSPVVSCNRRDAFNYRSSGLPIPDIEVRIARADAKGVGEIQVRGNIIMQGYYQNEEATKAVLDKEGWFSTGDSGYIDNKGFIYISGRVKSVIVSAAGKNIYPEEVETALNTSPLILESIVLGARMADRNREDVCAIVVPDMDGVKKHMSEHHNYNAELSEVQLQELLWKEVKRICEHMAEYKRVKKIKVRMEELPKTSTRKVKRFLFNGERF